MIARSEWPCRTDPGGAVPAARGHAAGLCVGRGRVGSGGADRKEVMPTPGRR